MARALEADRLDGGLVTGGAVAGAGPAGGRGVGGGLGLADAQHVRPLLDLLAEVGVAQGVVGGAVPQLHTGARAGVAGVGSLDQVAPLLGGLDDGAVGAGGVPLGAVGGGEAAERYAGEGGAGREHVGVVAEEDVRHHRTGGDAQGVDAGGVGRVGAGHPVDHRLDADRVAAAVPVQGLRRGDVEALAGAGDRRVDDDEAQLVGQGGVFGAGVHRRARSPAVVHGHDDRRVRGDGGRDVHVHLEVAGVGAEAGDLGEGGGGDGLGAGGGRGCHEGQGRE